MIRIEIKNKASGLITHQADFTNLATATEWIEAQKAKGKNCAWGRPAWRESIPILDENDEPVLDENGDPTFNYVDHADEFWVLQTDVTGEYAFKNAKELYLKARAFGQDLVATFSIENAAMGITAQESATLISIAGKVLTALGNGYLETAVMEAKAIDSNDYDGTYLNTQRLLQYVNKIEEYLGVAQSESL